MPQALAPGTANTSSDRISGMKVLLFAAACACSTAWAAAPTRDCAELARTKFGADVTIEAAKSIAAAAALPAHCEVRGVIWPEARFIAKLPTDWNERFQMVGNGGWAGVISIAAMDTAIRSGYATISTDTGHDSQKEPGAIFALKSPTNPNAERKVVDHGYLAVHETALLGKKLIRALYGTDTKFSYWVGCSTGGRQGLMEAQRYPEDFDGYVVGAPVLNLTGLQTKAVYNWIQIGQGTGQVKPEKFAALAEAVYGKCDATDGLKDGLIENPKACDFDARRDLKPCAAVEDASCFTAPQIAALHKIYDGVRNSKGDLLFPGMPPGGEAMMPGRDGKLESGWGGLQPSFGLGDTFMKYMAFDQPRGANWDYRQLNVDTDPAQMVNVGLRINATITDLTAVKMRGGKIVHYHGWADPGVTANMSVAYYQAAQNTMGEAATRDFYRFFPVPGMFHCSGGPGCGNVDWLSAVREWVENGKAPEMLIGARADNKRTRPICAWPATAKYKGNGSIDEAANFTCSN
jgi:pimeloyl-ACP methyl ester carboxylesterase